MHAVPDGVVFGGGGGGGGGGGVVCVWVTGGAGVVVVVVWLTAGWAGLVWRLAWWLGWWTAGLVATVLGVAGIVFVELEDDEPQPAAAIASVTAAEPSARYG
jgi:hypothetical protein